MKHMKKREWSLPKGFENEPDIVKGYHCGLAYRIVRDPEMGHLCGYIKLPQRHPWLQGALKKRWGKQWFSKKYQRSQVGYDFGPIQNLSVHGGVTFFGRISRGRGHWVGFDCAHCDDFVPGMERAMGLTMRGSVYRSIDYARMECMRMAQAAALASFIARKNRQASIHRARMERAEEAARLARGLA